MKQEVFYYVLVVKLESNGAGFQFFFFFFFFTEGQFSGATKSSPQGLKFTDEGEINYILYSMFC
jgi:hypothetical protein